MHPHLNHAFKRLKKSLFTLSAAVEENLHLAVKAVLEGEPGLVDQIRARDLEIDLMEVDFEEECLKVLALHQPVAIDLRFMVAVLKINNDLERIGDLAVSIAEHAPHLTGKDPVDTARKLPRMAEKAQSMLRKSLDAIVGMDADLAREVLATDDEVDADYYETSQELKALMRKDSSQVDELLGMMLVCKHVERIADLATNIAEDAIYMADGEIVRHGRYHASGER
ncbi:phosphate signaling complex protein PhoU [bacterium]|nr:phosphate signaling complex protein PhoU [bacterium]